MKKNLKHKIAVFSLLLAFVSLFSMGIFMQSCSNDLFNEDPPKLKSSVTSADLFVKSAEFIVFQNNIENLAKNILLNYGNLSKSDKNELAEITKKIIEGRSVHDSEKFYYQINSLIKIDLKERLIDIFENSEKMICNSEIKDISRKDIITALEKKRIKESTFIRLKNGNEVEGNNQKCRDSCSVTYVAEALICAMLPPPADIGCGLIATIAYLACLDAC